MKKKVMLFTAAALLSAALVTPGFAQNNGQVKAQEAKMKAEERVAEIKKKVAERKAEVNAEKCEAREARIQAKLPKLAKNATTLKTVIDRMYTRVQGFYAKGQLTVANYAELKTAVDTAKADAEEAIEAIDSFEFTFDCDTAGVGTQLDSYRTVVGEAKTALKEYRTKLVDLISAMKSAKASSNDSDDSTEDTNDDNGGTN